MVYANKPCMSLQIQAEFEFRLEISECRCVENKQ